MSQRLELRRQQLLKKLMAHVKEKASQQKHPLLNAFAERYFSIMAYEEMAVRSTDELYAIMRSHWEIVQNRPPIESRIRIFNPTIEKEGWSSHHTVIQISHDNMPFLVDTVHLTLLRKEILIHLMLYTGGFDVVRNQHHKITSILPPQNAAENSSSEAPIYIEIEKIEGEDKINELEKALQKNLADNAVAVADWEKMHLRMASALADLEKNPPPICATEIEESKDFLKWLLHKHFIFLGCRDFRLIKQRGNPTYRAVPGTGLGLLKSRDHQHFKELSSLPPLIQKKSEKKELLVLAKTDTLSSVHRDTYTDYIGIRQFDSAGNITGEIRFVGLFTSTVYNSSPHNIPFLRQKVETALNQSNLNLQGHAGKALRYIIENLPRDDLFQASADEILALGRGIFGMQARSETRLFMRRDIYGRYFSCLVYLPRDRFSMTLREKIESILKKELNAYEITFDVKLFESQLAHIHYLVRIHDTDKVIDEEALEKKIISAAQSWQDEYQQLLVEKHGEKAGLTYFRHYKKSFPTGYQEEYRPEVAVNYDLPDLIALSESVDIRINLYERDGVLHFRLFRRNHVIQLSDVLPMLENFGLRVLEECPHELFLPNGMTIWLNDFEAISEKQQPLDLNALRKVLIPAFKAVWRNQAESDRFNALATQAGLSWRLTAVLRAYARYAKQIGFPFSHHYIAESLNNNPAIALLLSQLFEERFDPAKAERTETSIQHQIEQKLEDVANLDEDRIIRRYIELILATVRTNFYQEKPYFSFKFNPALITNMPKPILKYEIFVYSPRFEGIHLRGAKVARGGLRWSDRPEDFRTEVLGLVKAQQVKNAVIVPLGAKGGFVPRYLPENATRDEILKEGIACYQQFIRGLLDITDNLIDRKIAPPSHVTRYDEDDPYLVVAADKGTATFSDIANAISKEYGFWLGDAFASGGSAGYDHKKMGITARGAWESVKRLFKETQIDIDKPFTVVGIGDMSGDVFGNGLLYSKNIKLIAAFNHQHIFIDPDPDPLESFNERARLFKLPRSSWGDYNLAKISTGGGIFSRSEKFIRLSPEIKKCFNFKKEKVLPSELIRAILKAKVDLLWNGGIGTYVKATTENHTDAGDRANDHIRINADELQCLIIGEGGNLGLTQAGRIEYNLNGGHCYTDFIDNSAGVDCSDHEVNIKILLNEAIIKNGLTLKERNKLLTKMTKEVAQLVLDDNFQQTRAISMAFENALTNLDLYARLIDHLEQQHGLDRALEQLPFHETLKERKAKGKGLTNPELSVLLAYSKIILKKEILKSELPEDPCFSALMFNEFPAVLHERYYLEMQSHPLRRDIITTHLANKMINEMGLAFIYRMTEETGAEITDIIKAFTVARRVFDSDRLRRTIESAKKIEIRLQYDLLKTLNQLIRRATRWFLYNFNHIDIDEATAQFQPIIHQLNKNILSYLPAEEGQHFHERVNRLVDEKLHKNLAHHIAALQKLLPALDIAKAAIAHDFSLRDVATLYFSLDQHLNLDLLRSIAINYPINSKWDALARISFSDEIDRQQRHITLAILSGQDNKKPLKKRLQNWLTQKEKLLTKWHHLIEELQNTDQHPAVILPVVLRELKGME